MDPHFTVGTLLLSSSENAAVRASRIGQRPCYFAVLIAADLAAGLLLVNLRRVPETCARKRDVKESCIEFARSLWEQLAGFFFALSSLAEVSAEVSEREYARRGLSIFSFNPSATRTSLRLVARVPAR